jgi:subtilisin family serine protease
LGKGLSCVAATVAALCVVPIASADRVVSVGDRTPAALHGLQVVSRIDALRTAEVRVPTARAERALRSRRGIRFSQRAVSRVQADAPIAFAAGLAVPEWQWNAVHADLVPPWVQRAAHSITIAIVDTGADARVPSIAAKSPVTWNVANGVTTVHDSVGHGTFVASLAAGTISDANGMSGFGGDAQLMIVQANRGSTAFSDVDESAAIVWAVDHGANIINLSLGGAQTSQVERSAIDYATQHGVLLVAAAGNSGEQGNPTVFPAA